MSPFLFSPPPLSADHHKVHLARDHQSAGNRTPPDRLLDCCSYVHNKDACALNHKAACTLTTLTSSLQSARIDCRSSIPCITSYLLYALSVSFDCMASFCSDSSLVCRADPCMYCIERRCSSIVWLGSLVLERWTRDSTVA